MATLPVFDDRGRTLWACDRCGALGASPNAFQLPFKWYSIYLEHSTASEQTKGLGHYCKKDCMLNGLQYHRYTDLIPKE